MKISDLPRRRTDEAFGDWLAGTGLMGSANKAAAQSKQQQEQAYKIGLKDFTNKINGALKTAVSSGAVQIPQAPAAPQAAAPINYDIPTAQRQAQAGQQPQAAAQAGQAGQTGQQAKPQSGQQPPKPGQPQKPATAATPKTPTTAQAPSTAGSQSADQEPADVGGIQPEKGKRLELRDKSDRQMTYYKTDRGWFNAANERVTKPASVQYLDQQANAQGGAKFTIKEVPIPPPPANITKGGKSADAQANRQAKLDKKNQQRQQQQDDDDSMNESYRHLNWLLENRILREQNEDTISSFVQDFITGQTSKFPQNPAYLKRTKALADQAEAEYLKTKGISAELSKQLWDLIWSWSQIGGSQKKSQGGQQATQQGGEQAGDEQEFEQLDDRESKDLYRTGQFLQKAAKDPSTLKDRDHKPFRDQIVKLAKTFGGK